MKTFTTTVRIDTPEELTAYSHGGILPYVLRQLVRRAVRNKGPEDIVTIFVSFAIRRSLRTGSRADLR